MSFFTEKLVLSVDWLGLIRFGLICCKQQLKLACLCAISVNPPKSNDCKFFQLLLAAHSPSAGLQPRISM